MNFTAIDWIIVAGYLGVSMVVGIIGKRYIGNVSHYLVAGRELGVFVGIATLAATEIGTITYMYNGELGYKYGFASFVAALISGLVMIVVGRTGFVISRFHHIIDKTLGVPPPDLQNCHQAGVRARYRHEPLQTPEFAFIRVGMFESVTADNFYGVVGANHVARQPYFAVSAAPHAA